MKITSPLASLFGTSPFGPLQRHMRVVERSVQGLPPLVIALGAGDMESVARHKTEIFALEHEADDMKNEIRSALPATLFLPVSRRDLLDLLSCQDAIADAAQDAAGLLAMGKLQLFPALHEPLTAFCHEVLSVTEKARGLVDQLDELVEVGFRGREADRLLSMIDEVAALESVTDEQGSALVQLLFEHEQEIGPLSVVFWYELIRTLGRVADEAENVGDRLRLLIAR